jgi:broad specificity phosphatase PhoE
MSADGQELFLVRHGQTSLNAGGVLRGRIDAPLDPVGEAEAAALAALFAATSLERIWHSPLQRAAQTARAIGRIAGVQATAEPGFLDRDYGPFNGQPLSSVLARHPSVDDAPDVESRPRFVARVVAGLDVVLASSAAPTMVVAHDAVNRALLTELTAEPERDLPQPTGCWNELHRTGERWHAVVVDFSCSSLPCPPRLACHSAAPRIRSQLR